MKPVGEPDALIGHVRFDERGWETERWPLAPSYRAHPRLYLRVSAATSAMTVAIGGQADVEWTPSKYRDLPNADSHAHRAPRASRPTPQTLATRSASRASFTRLRLSGDRNSGMAAPNP